MRFNVVTLILCTAFEEAYQTSFFKKNSGILQPFLKILQPFSLFVLDFCTTIEGIMMRFCNVFYHELMMFPATHDY